MTKYLDLIEILVTLEQIMGEDGSQTMAKLKKKIWSYLDEAERDFSKRKEYFDKIFLLRTEKYRLEEELNTVQKNLFSAQEKIKSLETALRICEKENNLKREEIGELKKQIEKLLENPFRGYLVTLWKHRLTDKYDRLRRWFNNEEE